MVYLFSTLLSYTKSERALRILCGVLVASSATTASLVKAILPTGDLDLKTIVVLKKSAPVGKWK